MNTMHITGHARSVLTGSLLAAGLIATPMLLGNTYTTNLVPISTVHAAEHGHGGQGAGAGMQGQGAQGGNAGADSQRLVDSVLRGKGGRLDTMVDEDTDRPDWAGGGGKGDTGQPPGAGTNKGDLYGDLYVILRDDNGEPILDQGRVQFLDADGNVIPYQSDDPEDEGFTEVADASLLQEVDFGRTNLVRSPSQVFDRALAEAESIIATDADGVLQYDEAGRIVVVQEDGTELTIDSPLENLALYLDAMTNPDTVWTLDDAATFLAAGSSKTGNISVDMVVYLNSILDINADGEYFDFSTFSYDRDDAYSGTVSYWVDNGDGTATYIEDVKIIDAIFDGEGTDTLSGAAAFAQAADDALQVIEFIHEPIH